MQCVNPRDVAYIFRDYTRKIHAKLQPADPNYLKISVMCGKVCMSSITLQTIFSDARVYRSSSGANTCTLLSLEYLVPAAMSRKHSTKKIDGLKCSSSSRN